MQMFAFTFKQMNLKVRTAEDSLKKNAMIESHLNHAYCLYRFFYQGETEHKNSQTFKRKKTDIIAEDYIEKRLYFKQNRTAKRFLKGFEKKRNKQLAHLTYNRINMRGWNSKISERLWKTVDVFLVALPQNRKKWFSDTISDARVRQSATTPSIKITKP